MKKAMKLVTTRVPLSLRSQKSLRNLAPDHWAADGKTLLIRSVVASYAMGPIEHVIAPDLAQFIKENFRAARRMRGMSISAYESIASVINLASMSSIGTMTFVALTAGVSTLDALACILRGTLFGKPVKKGQLPGMKELRKQLEKHPFHDCVASLLDSDWCKKLYQARNRVVHQGFWPGVETSGDFILYQENERFEFGAGQEPRQKNAHPLDLVAIMRGLLCDLEDWEQAIEHQLKSRAFFSSLVVPGETKLQYTIDGQAECDWSITSEIDYHTPTVEFLKLWNEQHQKVKPS